ncbi:prolipoprotein diacylglyceryl transferase family protein [Streptosporangium algeriense]|uniref:Phosphatidylglycerol--prolipoprotein diacylglyceryl transferase n=1 Tax=Streptosporangium algeriense TaxID=1682748 RepID=A0ABW3DW78_9ACTN
MNLGFVEIPIRAYTLCMVAGVVAASLITSRRMRSRGAPATAALDIAVWAVPFGIVGARLYHVITTPEKYWGAGGEGIMGTLRVWEGGIGIWGAVAGGALGAWIACRRMRLSFPLLADCIAVGLPIGQVIARLGNWFNNELYGGRTDLPWGLEVHRMSGGGPGEPPIGSAAVDAEGRPVLLDGLYHPAFLYEMVWNLGVAGFVYWLDRRYRFGKGRAFALYVMAYTVGRAWIETMRTDEALVFFGQRLNFWVAILVFLSALAYFVLRRGPRDYLVPAPDGEGFVTVTEERFLAHKATGPQTGPQADAQDRDQADVRTDDQDHDRTDVRADAQTETGDTAPSGEPDGARAKS